MFCMAIPPIPPPLESLGSRPFSFYPAIVNIEHNEWLYRKATWSEVLVTNAKTGEDLWIPRRFLGEFSRIDDPVVIVGLSKELEYRGGAVWPYQRRVIQMPLAVNDAPRSAAIQPKSEPAPVIGIRVESTESRLGRLVAIALACGTVACILVVALSREGVLRPRVHVTRPRTRCTRSSVTTTTTSPSCRSWDSPRRTAGSRRPAPCSFARYRIRSALTR